MSDCSLYIHIPYCRRRCDYCDFHSAVGEVSSRYIEALCSEIPYETEFDTAYIGGGTPSLMSSEQLITLCDRLKVRGEFTLEGNPDSLDKELLTTAHSLGINRLSMGVQSVNNRSLKALGRLHDTKQVERAIITAKEAGINNISIDLMVGIPYESCNDIAEFVRFAEFHSVNHVSCYMLKLEENTPLIERVSLGDVALPDSDETTQRFEFAIKELSNYGYERYEISNFAKPGFESRHNLRYWNCRDYLGIGASAHSCVCNQRFFYEADTEQFMQNRKKIDDGICDADDFIMLQTRLVSGLSIDELFKRFGYRFTDESLWQIARLEKGGLLRYNEKTLALTERGMLLQNSILAEIL